MTEHAAHVGVGIIVFNQAGEILLGLRRGEHESTLWGLPGGKLNFGETVFACARREVLEETGLAISDLELVSLSDDLPGPQAPHHFVTIGVQAKTTGEPNLCEPQKCSEWRWFSLKDLPDPLFAPSRRVLEHFAKKTCYEEGV